MIYGDINVGCRFYKTKIFIKENKQFSRLEYF